jgi:hypothetical protein
MAIESHIPSSLAKGWEYSGMLHKMDKNKNLEKVIKEERIKRHRKKSRDIKETYRTNTENTEEKGFVNSFDSEYTENRNNASNSFQHNISWKRFKRNLNMNELIQKNAGKIDFQESSNLGNKSIHNNSVILPSVKSNKPVFEVSVKKLKDFWEEKKQIIERFDGEVCEFEGKEVEIKGDDSGKCFRNGERKKWVNLELDSEEEQMRGHNKEERKKVKKEQKRERREKLRKLNQSLVKSIELYRNNQSSVQSQFATKAKDLARQIDSSLTNAILNSNILTNKCNQMKTFCHNTNVKLQSNIQKHSINH